MRVISHGPTNKNVFKEVARLRSEDAATLLAGRRVLGAVYLLGYSIECYLKFAVCERNEWSRLPEIVRLPQAGSDTRLYVHEWPVLVEVAGIGPNIKRQKRINAIYSYLREQWGPNLRYRTSALKENEGTALYNDLTRLYEFLKDIVP